MKPNKMLLLGSMALMLAACSSMGGPNQTDGTLVGGAAGGIIGAQFGNGPVGPIIGTLGGAVAGAEIGKYFDNKKR